MDDGKQEAQAAMRNRRGFLGTALGLGAGLGAGAGLAQAGNVRTPIRWVHANSAMIGNVHGLEHDRVEGNARVVNGRSWSNVQLHFAVPSPVLDTGVPVRVAAVWVRFKAQSGALISALTLHDCERTLTRQDKMDIRREDWDDVRIALAPPCLVARSLGLTLECTFGDVARQIAISAIGCEFELTT